LKKYMDSGDYRPITGEVVSCLDPNDVQAVCMAGSAQDGTAPLEANSVRAPFKTPG
jgi:hypothetical protein